MASRFSLLCLKSYFLIQFTNPHRVTIVGRLLHLRHLRFRVLSKDILICGLEKPGTESLTLQFMDNGLTT